MNNAAPLPLHPSEVIRILIAHTKRWLIPALVVTALATAYALFRPATWEASQALIVRDQAANRGDGPGKFAHTDEMKTVQETILELAKSRSVLGAALAEVGPPAGYDYDGTTAQWPTPLDVADLRDAIKLTPPKGAEFGTTEVFYLTVKDHSKDRGIAMNRAVCDQLQTRFEQLLETRTESVIGELGKTVALAQADLDKSTARLTALETEVGADLTELRVLNQSTASDSTLSRTIGSLRESLRQIQITKKANSALLVLLQEAQDDPGRLLAAPIRLFQSQSALQRLKDGLVDAQIATAALKGTRSDEHPLVISARQSEEEIGRHLHNELAIAIRGLGVELRMNGQREATLGGQLAKAIGRLDKLALLRAPYANQVAETANRTELVRRAQENLAEAQASRAGAEAGHRLSRIDTASTGVNPVGPSRTLIVLIGAVGGLTIGLGVLLLTVQPTQPVVTQPAATQMVIAQTGEYVAPLHASKPSSNGKTTLEAKVVPQESSLSFTQALQKAARHASA